MAEKSGALGLRDDHVEALRRSLSSAEHGLGSIPDAVKIIVREEGWRERIVRQTGQRVAFGSFAELVTADPLDGLGATLDQLRGLCRDDPEALDAIDRATQNAHGVHISDGYNVPVRPEGNTAAKALRRLRKDRPDLHGRVLAREMSPHAAMIAAGFRHATLSVPLTADGLLRLFERLSTEDQQAALSAIAAGCRSVAELGALLAAQEPVS